MPELGKYAAEVLLAYAGSIANHRGAAGGDDPPGRAGAREAEGDGGAQVKPLYFLPFAVILALGVAFWWGNGREGQNELPSTMIGRAAPGLDVDALGTAPELTREMLDGEGLKLVNFWASWCAPCRVEHPNLVALQEAGVPIYGINFKDDPAKAQAFLRELGGPLCRDRHRRGGAQRFRVGGLRRAGGPT